MGNVDAAAGTPVLRGGPVVIVGGGVVGLAIAYHLALRGYAEVTLLERATLASGTTAKGVGGVRQQFSSPINIALSRRAVDAFAAFDERVGGNIGYRQHGFLFLIDDPAHWTAFLAAVERQRAGGVPVQVLAPDDVAAVMPGVRPDGLIGATYCPTDGSAVPAAVAAAYAREARARGVRLLEGTALVGIERDAHGAIAAAQTTAGRFAAEVLIDAGGPWAAEIGRLAGVELPIVPRRRQAATIDPLPWLTPDRPFTIDLGSGAYVQPRPDGAAVGGVDRGAEPGFDETIDPAQLAALRAALARRIPALAEATIRRAWVGIRDMTPDDHAIVGPVPAVPGLWVAAGFSGHGFVHSPVVGEQLARWLLTGAPELDLGPLQLDRFAAGAAITEGAVF